MSRTRSSYFSECPQTRLSSVLTAQKHSGGYTVRVLGKVRRSYVKTRNSSFISASYFASTKVTLPSSMTGVDLATILFWESTFGREKNETDDRARDIDLWYLPSRPKTCNSLAPRSFTRLWFAGAIARFVGRCISPGPCPFP